MEIPATESKRRASESLESEGPARIPAPADQPQSLQRPASEPATQPPASKPISVPGGAPARRPAAPIIKPAAGPHARPSAAPRFTESDQGLFDNESEKVRRRRIEAEEAQKRLDELFEMQGAMFLRARVLAVKGMLKRRAAESKAKGVVLAGACSVCMGEIASDDSDGVDGVDAVDLPCGHVFHNKCIAPWIAVKSDCPNCRKRL